MSGLPTAVIVTLASLSLVSKEPLNRALSILREIKFIIVSDESIRKFSIPDKQLARGAKSIKKELITAILHKTEDKYIRGMPYLDVFRYLWSCFASALCSIAVCLTMGFLPFPHLDKQTNMFALVFGVVFIVFVRFGMMAAFNRKLHRRFSVAYALMWCLISLATLRSANLGVFDCRPALTSWLSIPPVIMDVVISISVGIMASALATPMLYELFAFRLMNNMTSKIASFDFALECYVSCRTRIYKVLRIAHTSTGMLPIVAWSVLHFGRQYELDIPVIAIFLLLETIMAMFKLYSVHDRAQICYLQSLESVADFDKKRSAKAGLFAQATVERSLLMIPVSALSMSLHPMLVIVSCGAVASSITMSGLHSILVRHIGLFIIAVSEFMMLGHRVVGIFFPSD